MKSFFSPKFILCQVVLGFGLFNDSASAATLSVTPSAISNTYTGMITLQLGGLTNTETVVVERFLDANTNSVIDAGDLLTQSFRVTDGQVETIGGKTNVTVPGDSNATGGAITTLLNYYDIDIEHIIGRYAFKLSSPSSRFAPVTNIFNVTNTTYAQSFAGQVRSNGTATAVANALVVLLEPSNDGAHLVGGVVANNLGNYTIKAPPGTYLLAAFKSNFVGDFTVSSVVLGAGATVSNNVNVILATRTISGRVADAANTNTPLPGTMMFFDSDDGLTAIGFTGTNGNFNVPVTASGWQVEPQETDLALHGYFQVDGIDVDTVTGSVSNVNFFLLKGTAMFYGSIKDNFGTPLPGFEVDGYDQNNQYGSETISDANGNYAVVALAGEWGANLVSDDPALTNYVFSGSGNNVTLTNGQAVQQNFVLQLATNHITGSLRDSNDSPISGIRIFANAGINGTNYQTAGVLTDGSGNYSLNVINGNWGVSVNCCPDCDEDALNSTIYQCPGNQNVNISNNNGVANFVAQICTGVEITTTNLDNGEVGVGYSEFLAAASCDNSFTWSLNIGSLPSGLQLNSSGQIFGTPNASGIFNFNVQAVNSQGSTNKNLSITILNAVQITTTSLPAGTVSQNIHTNLQASGGQAPYDWDIISGSLPPGVSFNTGLIDGIPTTAGTFNFTVQVTDQLGATDNQFLSLTINNSAQPLAVTTTFLPNGGTGTSYSNQVSATGGQLPYSWSMTPGSTPLPPGLNLSTNGIVFGTPTNSGTFGFFLRVTDNNSDTADSDFISITITNPPLSVPSTNLPKGTVEMSYNAQLLATGGQPPYTWTLAPGSLPVPAGLNLGTNGVISGTPTTAGTNSFIVRATDSNLAIANRSMTIIINPKPTLSSPNKISSNQFQLRLTGVSNQNYTIQYSTTLTNWISFLTNNSPNTNAFNVIDSNATNGARFYRALIGP